MQRAILQGSASLVLLLASFVLAPQLPAQTTTRSNRGILARVDTKAFTEEDLERAFKFRNVPREMQGKLRPDFIELLIDTELMQKFLKAEKITAPPDVLNQKVKEIKTLLADPQTGEVDLKRLGLTEQSLRDELALPLKWRNYVSKTTTETQIEQFFNEHRERFDGTELRISQIFLAGESMEDPKQVTAALTKLTRIRQEILDGLPFAEAAKKYSDSPSGAKGGDLGRCKFHGMLSPQLKKVAFSLPKGELSQPFAGAKGVHLCVVTERTEGQNSLEDARTDVMDALSDELWVKKIKELKAKSKIDRTNG